MKNIRIILLCLVMVFLVACESAPETPKFYAEGLGSLEAKDYVAAEACFKSAIEAGDSRSEVVILYTVVSEYNSAKSLFEIADYSNARIHIDKIPDAYANYAINEDVDVLKSLIKDYEDGKKNLDIKDFATAEECFKSIIDKGYETNDINVLYTVVSEYNNAKESYDAGDFETAQIHIDKIPLSYADHTIAVEINALKDLLQKSKDIDSSISKVKSLIESGEYADANTIILGIDVQYASPEQLEEIEVLKTQMQEKKTKDIDDAIVKAKYLLDSGDYWSANEIVLGIDTQHATADQLVQIEELKTGVRLKKKNQDYVVLKKIDDLVYNYTQGLCKAVNTGDFRPLQGFLYEGSEIYTGQQSYIAYMANADVFEYIQSVSVDSVDWKTDTWCVITTSETYNIYYTNSSTTKTFRYTYDVIETADGQLFLTTLKDSK